MNWLNLPKNKQQELFKQLSVKTGIQPQAIEKDAWVTLVLRIIFGTQISEYLVFKGGTSLSKAYKLIQRFSEDIDLAINREYLGFQGELTKGQIRKLRRKSHDFVSNEMLNLLINEFKSKVLTNNYLSLKLRTQRFQTKTLKLLK